MEWGQNFPKVGVTLSGVYKEMGGSKCSPGTEPKIFQVRGRLVFQEEHLRVRARILLGCRCVCVCVGPRMGGEEADWGSIGLSSAPSALRNPHCCVQILWGRFAGTLAPPSQWNGEMANLEPEL